MKANIEKCENGYIVQFEDSLRTKKCFNNLEGAMDALLLFYEGRSREFSAGGYGEVVIMRNDKGPDGQKAQAVSP